jgi:hypothetical protein
MKKLLIGLVALSSLTGFSSECTYEIDSTELERRIEEIDAAEGNNLHKEKKGKLATQYLSRLRSKLSNKGYTEVTNGAESIITPSIDAYGVKSGSFFESKAHIKKFFIINPIITIENSLSAEVKTLEVTEKQDYRQWDGMLAIPFYNTGGQARAIYRGVRFALKSLERCK